MTAPSAWVHGYAFSGFREVISALTPEEVIPALALLERRVAAGLHAAGFLSYEAASGLNPHLTTHRSHPLPLVHFALFENRTRAPFPAAPGRFETSQWRLSTAPDRYREEVERVRRWIEAGDCYQVNLTLRQEFAFTGQPEAFFARLSRSQPTRYASYLEADRYRILSASPELFFSLKDGTVTVRPMKGTARRGRWCDEDRREKAELARNPKERAENLMIVDLLRNDLGMVAKTGSVSVAALFEVETLRTVHQMTSTVEARLRPEVGLVPLFQALFPCGSITGAPKRRSMEIIAELEPTPRGIYTGCIGYLSPGEAEFSVAIRTVLLDLATGRGELGIGSGITYDSDPEAEFNECLAKGRFAREEPPLFHLIESLLWDGEYFLPERHRQRLEESAAYFGFPFAPEKAQDALKRAVSGRSGAHKVRLLLEADGGFSCQAAPIAPEALGSEPLVAFASRSVDSTDPFLYHKTSNRPLYTEEQARRPECDQLLFANERGEVTEATYSNIVARIEGELVTPPLACGLLPGTFRAELLATGEIRERVILKEELARAGEIYLVNSVRKWRRVRLIS